MRPATAIVAYWIAVIVAWPRGIPSASVSPLTGASDRACDRASSRNAAHRYVTDILVREGNSRELAVVFHVPAYRFPVKMGAKPRSSGRLASFTFSRGITMPLYLDPLAAEIRLVNAGPARSKVKTKSREENGGRWEPEVASASRHIFVRLRNRRRNSRFPRFFRLRFSTFVFHRVLRVSSLGIAAIRNVRNVLSRR